MLLKNPLRNCCACVKSCLAVITAVFAAMTASEEIPVSSDALFTIAIALEAALKAAVLSPAAAAAEVAFVAAWALL